MYNTNLRKKHVSVFCDVFVLCLFGKQMIARMNWRCWEGDEDSQNFLRIDAFG